MMQGTARGRFFKVEILTGNVFNFLFVQPDKVNIYNIYSAGGIE